MTTSDPNEPKKNENPGMKLRSILSAPTDDGSAPPAPLPRKELPRKPSGSAGSRPSKPQKTAKPRQLRGDGTPRIRVQRDKIAPAVVNITSMISMVINVVLLIIIFALLRELTSLKTIEMTVVNKVLGGLHGNFVAMDQAHIVTSIDVKADVPVMFDLPVNTNTTVVLTEDTTINGARVTLNTGGLNIFSAPTNIILPAGTNLPIALDITVPVETTIPISLTVPVDIPLEKTDLHYPFVGLREVVESYHCKLDPEAKFTLENGTVYDLCPDELKAEPTP